MKEKHTRRAFVALAATALSGLISRPVQAMMPALAERLDPEKHPTPRRGIDGSKVLAASAVAPELRALFDGIRRHAAIADGIRCSCGCAEIEGFYSLLSCYEEVGMAQYCDVCQDSGRLVVRLRDEGKSLEQIRRAIDTQVAAGHEHR